eukprot:169760_1
MRSAMGNLRVTVQYLMGMVCYHAMKFLRVYVQYFPFLPQQRLEHLIAINQKNVRMPLFIVPQMQTVQCCVVVAIRVQMRLYIGQQTQAPSQHYLALVQMLATMLTQLMFKSIIQIAPIQRHHAKRPLSLHPMIPKLFA